MSKGAGQIPQDEHNSASNSKKSISALLAPGVVVTSDVSAAGVQVGKKNICRIRVTAACYVAFGNADTMAAVDSSTSPALELFTAGTYLIVASDDFIRMSAAPARLEVISA